MKIAVFGNGLQSHVVAALFASVGNLVDFFGKENSNSLQEPGLFSLYQAQQDAKRLANLSAGSQVNKVYDFIVISDISPIQVVNTFKKIIEKSIKQGTTFIIFTPSEIGEVDQFSNMLESKSLSTFVCSIPLLVREGRAIQDFSRPDNIIIGCDNKEALPKIKSLFYPFNRVKNVIKEVSTREAEFSCFAGNAMLATRLSFMNEMANLAEKSQVDIDVVRECIGSDPRIGRDYLYPGCGYGGQALDQNVEKIASKLRSREDNLGLLDVVAKINERQKDLLFRKIWTFFETDLKGKNIAIWGASFKPGSSNIEGAPAVKLIDALLAQGATVSVYDPLALDKIRLLFHNSVNLHLVESCYDALEGADVLAICTEWKEFWSPDLNKLYKKLQFRAIFDGRNILDPVQVKTVGLKYFGIGRGESFEYQCN
ncbi:nucleotide sugar dehydrogenase [Aliikangiella sp. IMCC44359]|uniref:nucleotide sugar dehydrogenase n=1 Tax=Aliikangiella sp. IMCC44359 TaxID=3459125 RepID=UPI00403A98D8